MQLPFRDIRNEEQFILEQFSDQDTLEVPNVYCCICKSSYGVNLACNHPGCTRTAHPTCMKLFGCHMETVGEVDDPLFESDMFPGSNMAGGRSSNVLYVSPNCQPPVVEANVSGGGGGGGGRPSSPRETHFSQKVFCPEHGRETGGLNHGGKLLHSTLSSLRIATKIMEDLRHSEKLKRQLFGTQMDIMSREAPIFSPLLIRNANALRIYWDYHLRGVLQESVKIRNGTIHKFKDNLETGSSLKSLFANGDSVISGSSRSPRKSQQTVSLGQTNPTPGGAASQSSLALVGPKTTNLKRTRSSGEVVEVPSLEDAIREARKQRELYKKELVASGVILKKRPPPNRNPSIPFSRLTDDELRESALSCLRVVGNSSKLAMSLISGFNNSSSETNGANSLEASGPGMMGQQAFSSSFIGTETPKIRSFCIKQHRHDCFRRRLAEFIICPPAIMEQRKKTLRSLTRQLKQFGVTAEELLASDVPLPPIKSKPPPPPPPAASEQRGAWTSAPEQPTLSNCVHAGNSGELPVNPTTSLNCSANSNTTTPVAHNSEMSDNCSETATPVLATAPPTTGKAESANDFEICSPSSDFNQDSERFQDQT